MDLATIGDLLGDFSTFAGNIGDAFQLIPEIFSGVFGFFADGPELSSNTNTALDWNFEASSKLSS